MKDINGIDIKEGYKVKTRQPMGGILLPGEAKTGIVENTKDAFGNKALQIKYRDVGKDYDKFILLTSKINEVICQHEKMSYNVGKLTCLECGYETNNS